MRFLVVAAISIWTGCASMIPDAHPPRTGVRSNGQPLAVVEDMKVWRSRDNVGELRVEDETGQRLATADVYATRTHTKFVWYPVQGTDVSPARESKRACDLIGIGRFANPRADMSGNLVLDRLQRAGTQCLSHSGICRSQWPFEPFGRQAERSVIHTELRPDREHTQPGTHIARHGTR